MLLARLDEGIALKEEPVEVELVMREALLRAMLLGPRRNIVEVRTSVPASSTSLWAPPKWSGWEWVMKVVCTRFRGMPAAASRC